MKDSQLRPTLEVLMLGGNLHVTAPFYALEAFLRSRPNVRWVSNSDYYQDALNQMRTGDVNTVFVEPSKFNTPTGIRAFIEDVRKEIPQIVFVLIFPREDTCQQFHAETGGRFRHYLTLFRDSTVQEFSDVIEKCEVWHLARFDYDVALSFAGEDRLYAEGLATYLKTHGARVFYDSHEQDRLWGKDLYQYLQLIYKDRARYCVIIASEHYAKKLWPKHELKQAQARSFRDQSSYLLPIRIDDSDIPGINETVGYLDGRAHDPEGVGKLLMQKLFFDKSKES